MKPLKDDLPVRIGRSIMQNRTNVPTLVVLYLNFTIGVFWLSEVARWSSHGESLVAGLITPLIASLALVASSGIFVAGIFNACEPRLISVASIIGYFAWVFAFLSWTLDPDRGMNVTVPIFFFPMVLFFLHAHLRKVVEGEG